MSRRRNISTDISTDPELNAVINEHGLLTGLLYTWMIPHAEDDCTLTGDPRKLLLRVIPGLRSVAVQDVVEALRALHDAGLITWDQEHKRISFPPSSFYRYQTYIPKAKRVSADNTDNHRKTPQITEEQRESPENPASPSPSPSPSPAPMKDTASTTQVEIESANADSMPQEAATPSEPTQTTRPYPKPSSAKASKPAKARQGKKGGRQLRPEAWELAAEVVEDMRLNDRIPPRQDDKLRFASVFDSLMRARDSPVDPDEIRAVWEWSKTQEDLCGKRTWPRGFSECLKAYRARQKYEQDRYERDKWRL